MYVYVCGYLMYVVYMYVDIWIYIRESPDDLLICYTFQKSKNLEINFS